jgi:hypothetical protein
LGGRRKEEENKIKNKTRLKKNEGLGKNENKK